MAETDKGQAGGGKDVGTVKSPTKIEGLGKVTAIRTDTSTSCAMSDGELYCWGANTTGGVGNGTNEDKIYSPVKINFPA